MHQALFDQLIDSITDNERRRISNTARIVFLIEGVADALEFCQSAALYDTINQYYIEL